MRMTRPARRKMTQQTGPLRVVLYRRVSTREQADSGLGLAAQETTLTAETARRGWRVVGSLCDEGVSGKSMAGRTGLTEALRMVSAGEADAIVVAKLDRLSRSLLDFAGVMARAQTEGWGLIALDVNVDTTTPSGRLVANLMAVVAEWEREVIGQRTKDALAEKKAQGVRLGRPRALPDDVLARMISLRATGATYATIATLLDQDGVATAQGGRWRSGTVYAALKSQAGQDAQRTA